VAVKKEMKVSGLSGAESVMGKCGKLEVYTLFNRKPMNGLFSDESYSVIGLLEKMSF